MKEFLCTMKLVIFVTCSRIFMFSDFFVFFGGGSMRGRGGVTKVYEAYLGVKFTVTSSR